jgi:hypothetical protein
MAQKRPRLHAKYKMTKQNRGEKYSTQKPIIVAQTKFQNKDCHCLKNRVSLTCGNEQKNYF